MIKMGTLSIVATPIGNLEDLGHRAIKTLETVNCILCENTRHTKTLLTHYSIKTATESLHEHNEESKCHDLIQRLLQGENFALVSDAGTPLISDPGTRIVAAAHHAKITVSIIPGPSALTAALSASGYNASKFIFEGFIPARANLRRKHFESLVREPRTLVFYEAPHRINASLQDMLDIFGIERDACLVKEVSKVYESIVPGNLSDILAWLEQDRQRSKGEFVIVLRGAEQQAPVTHIDATLLLKCLCEELSPAKAATIIASLTKQNRRTVYQQIISDK